MAAEARACVRGSALGTALSLALLLTAGCGGPAGASSTSSAPGRADRALAAKYMVIAQAGNRHLETDFGRLSGRDRNDLPAALADLRDAAATERLFDQRLMRIAFPPRIEEFAHLLYTANQARASLTVAAARSTSLSQLRGYERRLAAANQPVEQMVRVIRSLLGLPPPETS